MDYRPSRLRPDLEIVRDSPGSYLLIDGQTGECFAFGSAEKLLLDLLGEGGSPEAVAEAFGRRSDGTIGPARVREFVENLRQLGWLIDDPTARAAAIESNVAPPAAATAPAAAAAAPRAAPGEAPREASPAAPRHVARSPAAQRVLRLNFRFDLLVVLLGWLLHPLWIAPLAVAMLVAANVVLRHGGAMFDDLLRVWTAYPLWIFIPVFVLPKLLLFNLVHSLLIGMAARQHGVSIREFRCRWWGGVVPCFQTDLDDSFALLDRRGRRTLITIGWWMPLAVGAAAVIGWAMAAPGSGTSTLCLLLLPTCLFRLVLHSNPFFPYSSAYLSLCETVGEWQLLPWALDETAAWLGGRTSPRPLTDRERYWLRRFGLAYWAYRGLLICGLLALGWWWLVPTYELIGVLILVGALWWANQDLLAGRPQGARPGIGWSA